MRARGLSSTKRWLWVRSEGRNFPNRHVRRCLDQGPAREGYSSQVRGEPGSSEGSRCVSQCRGPHPRIDLGCMDVSEALSAALPSVFTPNN